jgi:hypothetical protein
MRVSSQPPAPVDLVGESGERGVGLDLVDLKARVGNQRFTNLVVPPTKVESKSTSLMTSHERQLARSGVAPCAVDGPSGSALPRLRRVSFELEEFGPVRVSVADLVDR